MLNIQEILAHHKLTMNNIVKCQVMLMDIKERADFSSEYVKFFSPPYPARSTYAVSGLALNSRVEIECIAVFK